HLRFLHGNIILHLRRDRRTSIRGMPHPLGELPLLTLWRSGPTVPSIPFRRIPRRAPAMVEFCGLRTLTHGPRIFGSSTGRFRLGLEGDRGRFSSSGIRNVSPSCDALIYLSFKTSPRPRTTTFGVLNAEWISWRVMASRERAAKILIHNVNHL